MNAGSVGNYARPVTNLRRDHAFYLLTGPMASGKSTVARLLAQRFERGVHVEGFTVALEDVIAGPMLPECRALIHSRPLHVVVLLPSPDAVAAREAAREQTGYTRWSVEQLHHGFAAGTPRIGLWLDTSRQTPEQTVDEIVATTAPRDAV